jgi:hypothetical protein
VQDGQQKAIALSSSSMRHPSKIQITQASIGTGQQIASMRIGMKESIFQNLSQTASDQSMDIRKVIPLPLFMHLASKCFGHLQSAEELVSS